MTFPQRAYAIVVALASKHPELAAGNDTQRAKLTRMMAEQIRFELGPKWGHKSASPTRPPSADGIAAQEGGRLYVWDWQHGTTRAILVRPGQAGEDITGQHFIDVSPGKNHLGEPIPPVEPAPTPGTPPTPDPPPLPLDVTAIIAKVQEIVFGLRADVQTLTTELRRLNDSGVKIKWF